MSKKTRLHHTKSRKVLRLQKRLSRGYKPGKIGPSDVSIQIKQQYGTMMTRSERRDLARAVKMPIRIFYNGHVDLVCDRKGGKAQ